ALRGSRIHGHYYVNDCYSAGVRNFVVEEYPSNMDAFPRANFVKVPSAFKALQILVKWHRSNFNIPVVGVTGSNGKTIVKEWIYQCLSSEKYVIRNPKSYNSQVGVPLSVWLLNKAGELGVFEAGISQPGEMKRLEELIQPSIGIFTNLGDAHQENFESVAQKLNEKLLLFSNCESIIYCSDNEMVSNGMVQKYGSKKLFTWSVSNTANLQITKKESHKQTTEIFALYNNSEISIVIPFIDKASIENAIHVWSFLLLQNYDSQFIRNKIAKLETVAMRLELKEGNNNCTIINDSYNSDLESLHIALDFLTYQNQHAQKVLILSDIAQSGFENAELYRQVANVIKQKKIDRLIGIGLDISQFESYFDLRKDFYSSTREFLENIDRLKLQNMTILLKGARSFEFENISNQLQKQTHRTVFEIDLNALEYNLDYFKNQLKPKTGIIAMLKASSYGSGTFEIANICQYHRVAAIAVAFTDEGVELRKSGIKIPIMVMNPEESAFASIMEHNIEPEIYDFNSLNTFTTFVEKQNLKAYPIHIKIDTGMNRAGFLPNEIPQLIDVLKNCESLKVKSVFSHLASADEPEQDEFTLQQIEIFENTSIQIINELAYKIKRHILNSAGIERFPKYQYDMVRLGIGLYGVSSINKSLAQVGSLTSSIVQIKKVSKGHTVGYSRKGVAAKDSEIATIPIGYADGYRRILSNGVGKIWVNGHLAPIIGNICMDMCMIDVTGLHVKEGDQVEIFGKHLKVVEVANWMQTIPYEVLTGISKRVKRTYQLE
ncbi:MAG: bifunctional UDP-N-acetylmuramoyl-tripeptide:D-alanyl-D-alanine ligase/alanine racemase, partial [Salinivirgaceae bacterium]|nr:bifunctional UDP-N-acetylmuramoyl-tripeptide:D-alanyl-D-alanine ligase/alanine racemase [Salinivirgaceae bacterium]